MKKNAKRKNKGLRFLCGLVLFLITISVIGTVLLLRHNLSVTFTPVSYSESNEAIANPYIGWYHTYSYDITEDTSFDPATVDYAMALDNTTRLCLLQINLDHYTQDAISNHGIEDIRSILDKWSTTDKQLMIRFCYNTGEENDANEPEDLSIVYRHMEQLSTVINEYASRIYILQGVFLGKNGETLSSGLLTTDSLADLNHYYASLTNNNLFLSVHDASQYLQVIGQNEIPPTLYTSDKTLFYRIGLNSDTLSMHMATAEQNATASIATFAPCGGAIANDSLLSNVAGAITRLEMGHISYLNADQDASILNDWKTTSYTGEDAYNGLTLYDYVTTHLGYRYIVKDVSLSFDTWKDTDGSLTLTLENIGFSNGYMPYDISLLIRNQKTEEMITLPLDTDSRSWNPKEPVTITQSLTLRDYDKGTYNLYLLLRDPASGEIIKLGNTMSLTSNGYLMGTLTLE